MIPPTWLTRCLRGAAFLTMLTLPLQSSSAQNVATAKGPGSYTAFGADITAFRADYGRRLLGGVSMFVDVNPTWRYGFEGEARYLRINSDEDVTETDYLAGPRIMLRPGPFRPYVKLLVGAGKISLPFHYGQGVFFTYAPGAGLDYIVGDRVTLRVIDFEYQLWPDFSTYGELRPYGLSAGISWRLNPKEHLVENANRRRWH
jgi:hypothetical protein